MVVLGEVAEVGDGDEVRSVAFCIALALRNGREDLSVTNLYADSGRISPQNPRHFSSTMSL